MNIIKFYRVLPDGKIQIGKVRISQGKRRRDPKKVNRRQAITAARRLGYLRTVAEAKGLAMRPIASAMARALGSL